MVEFGSSAFGNLFSFTQHVSAAARAVQPPLTQQPIVVDFPEEVRLNTRPQQFVRICFSNRGLSKVLEITDNISSETPNQSTVFALGQILKDLKIEISPAEGFQSLPEFFGVDYVGYIIDKERYDKMSGGWIRTDEYKILGSSANNFRDSRVAYGNRYRYRIRSIVKVTLEERIETFQNLEFVENIKEFEKKIIKRQLRLQRNIVSQIERVENIGLRPKSSQGKGRSHFNLLSNLQIVADESKTELRRVSRPIAYDRIRNLRRFKQSRVREPSLARGTISKSDLQKLINKNLEQVREEVIEYISYYYEGYPSNNWVYVGIYEKVSPPPPTAIKIVPNTSRKEIMITWLKPANSQRDIVGKLGGFYLYRRHFVGQEWVRIKRFKENENIYIDHNVLVGEKYIYALSSVDAHGLESFLSVQIEAMLNPSFNLEQKERPLKWISGSGIHPKKENDLILKKFNKRPSPLVSNQDFSLRPTPEFSETKKNLLIKVTSLDTHEQKEFNLDLKNINIRKVDV